MIWCHRGPSDLICERYNLQKVANDMTLAYLAARARYATARNCFKATNTVALRLFDATCATCEDAIEYATLSSAAAIAAREAVEAGLKTDAARAMVVSWAGMAMYSCMVPCYNVFFWTGRAADEVANVALAEMRAADGKLRDWEK